MSIFTCISDPQLSHYIYMLPMARIYTYMIDCRARGKLLTDTVEILKKIFGDVSRMEQCLNGIYFCITKADKEETRDYYCDALVQAFQNLDINMASAVQNIFLFDPLGQHSDEGLNREQVCFCIRVCRWASIESCLHLLAT